MESGWLLCIEGLPAPVPFFFGPYLSDMDGKAMLASVRATGTIRTADKSHPFKGEKEISMSKIFHSIIDALANATGLDSLKEQEADTYQLLFDGIPLTIEHLPENDAVLLFSALGKLPENNREDFCLKLLDANHFFHGTGGSTLSVSRNSDIVSLHLMLPMQLLTVAYFLQILETYMNAAERWSKACEQPGGTGASAEQHDASDCGWMPV
jgi:Tir chaperone protein (CesT).